MRAIGIAIADDGQRVMRGRTGPWIQQVENLGVRCQEIRQALGILGGAPTLGVPLYDPGR